jgi:glycosyltransferase involved in cell wall biosynthesis
LKISVLVTTLCRPEIRLLLRSLETQKRKPDEIIIVYKCDNIDISSLTDNFELPIYLYKQSRIGITGAINQGLEKIEGDISVFLDDDAIAPALLLRRYEELINSLPNKFAGVCSRDILYSNSNGFVKGPDDSLVVKIYRNIIVNLLAKPYPGLELFKQGVFINNSLKVKHGPCIPNGSCISLPFRGVNMAFRRIALEGLKLPEDINLGAAKGYEQLLGVMLVSRGYLYAYVSNNPVFHLLHPSISRSKNINENKTMEKYLKEALNSFKTRNY